MEYKEHTMGSLQTKGKWLICSLLFLVQLSVSSVGLSQPEDKRDEAIQQLNTIATRTQDYELAVNNWDRSSMIIIVLVVAVGIMGIAVSILQGVTAPFTKVACIALGGLVGSITLVNATLFPADHRTYGYSALKARQTLKELKALVPSDPNVLSEQILQVRVEKGLRLIKRMEVLEEGIYRAWAAPAPPTALLPNAYAQGIQGPLTRRTFEGVGESTSLAEARATAFTLAISAAAENVAAVWSGSGRDRVDPYAVRPFIEKVLSVVDEDVTELGRIVRYRVVVTVPAEFFGGQWSNSFGFRSRPEPLRSRDRVLFRIASAAKGGSGAIRLPKDRYVGLDLGELRLVAPERATSIEIIRGDGDLDSEAIEDFGSVRMRTAEGALSSSGNVVRSRGDDRGVLFSLRRVAGVTTERDLRQKGTGLQDGDSVEISIAGRVLGVSGDRLSLGERPGAAITIIRVARPVYR